MIAKRTGCPVAAAPDRAAAALELVRHSGCDVILSDDGLQHLALERDIEIAVIDAWRRFGNGRCLPAGPLREPASRLKSVDFVVANGEAREGEVPMRLDFGAPINLGDAQQKRTLSAFYGAPSHAVCGIGNPDRFFEQLRSKGLEIIPHAFPDHHTYRPADIDFADDYPVLMTEKDAVKCVRFAAARHWYLPVNAVLPDSFSEALVRLLRLFKVSE